MRADAASELRLINLALHLRETTSSERFLPLSKELDDNGLAKARFASTHFPHEPLMRLCAFDFTSIIFHFICNYN